jgi:hypothetical protein
MAPPVFARDRERTVLTRENISVQIGERTWISHGKADRNHVDSDGSPDVLSELTYNDVDSMIAEFDVNALLYNKYIFNVDVDVGNGGISGGKLTDRDYLGDNRTEIYSVSDSAVDDDYMYYVNAEIGYTWSLPFGLPLICRLSFTTQLLLQRIRLHGRNHR